MVEACRGPPLRIFGNGGEDVSFVTEEFQCLLDNRQAHAAEPTLQFLYADPLVFLTASYQPQYLILAWAQSINIVIGSSTGVRRDLVHILQRSDAKYQH